MNLKKFQYILLSLLLLSSSAYAMTPLEKIIDIKGRDNLYFSLARISSLLNHPGKNNYFRMKGYPKIEESFDYAICDVQLTNEDSIKPFISITVYIQPYLNPSNDEREFFSFKLRTLILKVCREFCENLSENDLKLIVKHINIKETDNNILFIWDETGPTYFPRFFESNFTLPSDKEPNYD